MADGNKLDPQQGNDSVAPLKKIHPFNEKSEKKSKHAIIVKPDMFESENHFYQKALNAQVCKIFLKKITTKNNSQVSSVVAHFMHLGNERVVARYCHLNPSTDAKKLSELLSYKPKYFMWSGADLFNVTTSMGTRKMVLIETNRYVVAAETIHHFTKKKRVVAPLDKSQCQCLQRMMNTVPIALSLKRHLRVW